MPTDVPTMTQEKEPNVATTLSTAGATTAATTGAQALACRTLRPSAGTSLTLLFHQGIDRLPISLNILGKQTLGFGSKTIGLHVRPMVQVMTILLFAISHYSWPIQHEHGWSTYHPMPFKVGRI